MPRNRVDQRTRGARAANRDARGTLLAAALAVFARRGYAAAGVEEIAAEAGYSKGAVYWHFAGKADLLAALLDERVDGPLRAVLQVIGTAPADADMAVAAAAGITDRLRDQRDAMVLDREAWSLALRDPEVRERYVALHDARRADVAAALEARAARHGLTALPLPAEDLARIVLALVGGLAEDELVTPGAVPPALLDQAFGLLWRGLAESRGGAAPDGERPFTLRRP